MMGEDLFAATNVDEVGKTLAKGDGKGMLELSNDMTEAAKEKKIVN